ncbi:MAG: 50S ribosomal protein L25 [Proteobacteria bacterium]|nr:50S ribosomal protein L25 [Pseudomonadota bacterium]
MELIDLKTNSRNASGTSGAKALRRKDIVPAILYGKQEPMLLSVGYGDLELVFKKSKTPQVFINLKIDGQTDRTAMIKEYQTDPVSQKILHVDFYEIAMDQKINLFVPVVVKGKAKGVEFGGMMQIIRRELEIRCLPANVPENIEIDVANLDIGDSVHVKDIVPPEGVGIPADVNFTVITVVAPKAAAAGEEGAEVAEIAESTAEVEE